MTRSSGTRPPPSSGSGQSGRGADDEEEMRLGWRMAGLAFVMSSEAAAGALIGLAIDYFARTGSRWTLIGGIVGIAVGLLSFVKGGLALNRLVAQKERLRREQGIPLPPPLPDEEEEDEESDKSDD